MSGEFVEKFSSQEDGDSVKEKVTVLSETYLISLSNNVDHFTLECVDNTNVSNLHEPLKENNSNGDSNPATDLKSDWIKFFGFRMPLTKSYATFAQKRRNKRLYLPLPSKLKCNKCYFRTQSRFALKLHIEQNHSDKTWYLCMGCDHTAETEAGMRDHIEASIMLESLQFFKADMNDNLPSPDKLVKSNRKYKERSRGNVRKRTGHNGGYICIKGKQSTEADLVYNYAYRPYKKV